MLRKISIASVVFIWALSLSAQEPSGRDQVISYYSSALSENAVCKVYLPPGYDASDAGKRYPVVYLLHGAGAGFEMFDLLLPVVSGFWATGYIKPFILVMPDGTRQPFKGSFYTNSELYGNFEDIIYQDLIPFIDSNYNTLAQKSSRGIWGFSMGAYGAFKQAFKHPEYYAAVAAHSGPVNLELLDILIPDLKEEQGNQAPFSWKYEPDKTFTSLMISMAGAFSPNLESENLVDFPLNEEGEIIPAVMERWRPHDISKLAAALPEKFDLPVYFDCGTLDEFKLIHHNRALSDTLTKYSIQHEFKEYIGDHTSGLVLRIPVALKFLDEALMSVISSTEFVSSPGDDQLLTYPNPAHGDFRVSWQSGFESEAEFQIRDVMGRLLFSMMITSGETIDIESDSYSPGLYFISVNSTQTRLSSRMLIK